MGRPGITYDQVAAAADALLAETGNATLKSVRDRLGTGGMGTVHKHLAVWNANRPKEPAPMVELPSDLSRGFSAWVTQAATAARADSEERLVQSQAEAFELSRASEQLEAERDELQEQIAELTTERDKAQATAAAHAAEIERLAKEVERERDLAGKAQIDAAQAQLKVDAQMGQLADMKSTIEKLNASLEAELEGRIAAEKNAAVLESERDASRKETDEERTRIKGLQSHLDQAHKNTDALRAKFEKEAKEERAVSDIERAATLSALTENAGLKAKLEGVEQIRLTLEAVNKRLAADLEKMTAQR